MIVSISRRVYYGWFVAAAAGGIEFANAASAISILTIFVNPMTDEFGWSRTQISGATSLGAIIGAALAPFTGRMVDRIGARSLLVIGGTVVALGCLYLSAVQTLLGFYVAFTLVRIADQGFIKIGAPPAAGKWFLRYRGRAIALVFFAGSAGIIVIAPVVQLVIDAWGWRASWTLLSGVMLFLGVVPCWLLIRRQPEDLGLVVDGTSELDAVRENVSASLPVDSASREGEVNWPLSQVVKTPSFWLIITALFVVSIASSGVSLHLVPHLTQQGLTPRAAVGVISLLSSSSAAAILVLGFLAERVSPRLLMASVCLLLAGSIGVLLVADSLLEAFLFAVLQGISSGGLNTLGPILWANYYGRGSLGSIHGLSRASQVVGFALGPLILGIAYDATGGYQTALIYFAVVAVSSSFLVLSSRQPSTAISGEPE